MEATEFEDFAELIPVSKQPALPLTHVLGLVAAAIVGCLLVVPYTRSVVIQMKQPGITPQTLPLILAVSVVFEVGLSAAAIALGVWMGGKVGLGSPLLAGLEGASDGRKRAFRAIGLAVVLGVAMGGAYIASMPLVSKSLPESVKNLQNPPPWEGFLASIGAGIREEIWLRFGFMTFLVWLGTLVTRRRPAGAGMIGTCNVLAALLFGAMHLPQAAGLIGLTPAVVALVFIGNGFPGIVFGWLYWRKGLIAAIVSHFVIDVVLKVVVPLLGL
jgi:hypothetical protein